MVLMVECVTLSDNQSTVRRNFPPSADASTEFVSSTDLKKRGGLRRSQGATARHNSSGMTIATMRSEL